MDDPIDEREEASGGKLLRRRVEVPRQHPRPLQKVEVSGGLVKDGEVQRVRGTDHVAQVNGADMEPGLADSSHSAKLKTRTVVSLPVAEGRQGEADVLPDPDDGPS